MKVNGYFNVFMFIFDKILHVSSQKNDTKERNCFIIYLLICAKYNTAVTKA